MGLSRNPTLITVALVISCVGLLLHIIGYASPYWYNITLGSIKAHGGIWRECLEILGISSCSTVKGDTADTYQFAAQAMGMIAIFFGVAGVLVIVLKQFMMKDSSVMNHGYIIAIGLLVATASFILIEITVLAGKAPDTFKNNLSWAFGIDVAALIIIVIAAVVIGLPFSSSSVKSSGK